MFGAGDFSAAEVLVVANAVAAAALAKAVALRNSRRVVFMPR
jgi:hypothetical protein